MGKLMILLKHPSRKQREDWMIMDDQYFSFEAMPEREINYVNAEQKVAQILGHSKDLITLSLTRNRGIAVI